MPSLYGERAGWSDGACSDPRRGEPPVARHRRRIFELEEAALRRDALAAAIAADAPAGSEHAVARHNDGDRVAAAGIADGARRRIGVVREFAIGARLAVGNA